MKFNTAIASMMALLNDIYDNGKISEEYLATYLKLLCPFAPHLCEEMESMGREGFISLAEWPEYDEAKTVDQTVEIGVQVNGKLRGTVAVPTGCDKETAFATAKANEKVAPFLDGKTLVKEIYVPNKIVNFVVR